MGLMAMDDSDSEDEDEPKKPSLSLPLAAPRPGYALSIPAPALLPADRGHSPPVSPSTPGPHPLTAPMTPIQPAFARPQKGAGAGGVTFAGGVIMRGTADDVPLARRGEKGDEFWRRFSTIIREETAKPTNEKTSRWLRKTQDGTSSMSRWVWCIGLMFLLLIGAAAGAGYYFTHQNKPTHEDAPKSLGGPAGDHTNGPQSALTATGTHAPGASGTSAAIHPTFTVARKRGHTNASRRAHNRAAALD
jgi:hypothetical protein